MTTIYVVTEGEDEDYQILGLFSDESVADQWSDRWRGRVEEYELDGFAPRFGKTIYRVEMTYDGLSNGAKSSEYFHKPEASLLDRKIGGKWLLRFSVYCFAKDEQHAIEIANKKRLRLIASGKWPTEGET